MRAYAKAALIGLMIAASYGIPAAAGLEVPTVALFGFHLINTSLEPTSASENGNLQMLDDLFKERLHNSGRFAIVPLPLELQQKIATGPEIGGCNGCERD